MCNIVYYETVFLLNLFRLSKNLLTEDLVIQILFGIIEIK